MIKEIGLGQIINAQRNIRGYIHETPCEENRRLSHALGFAQPKSHLFLKYENLQRTGSFKLRGALNAMFNLSSEQRKKGIITASAGNHAQGVAFGNELLHLKSTIVVPHNTPQTKIKAIQAYRGVELRVEGQIYDDSEAFAKKLAKDTDRPFVSGYNHPDIIAGQGTMFLEIWNQCPQIDTLVIPLSGGGLFSGIAIAAKALNPQIRCFGVQSEACPVMVESLKAGRVVDIPMLPSIAEGLHGGVEKNTITFPYIQRFCEDVLLVSEDQIKTAIGDLMNYAHQIVEGAGAVGIAAVRRYREKFEGHHVAIIISGGNLDLRELREVINHYEQESGY